MRDSFSATPVNSSTRLLVYSQLDIEFVANFVFSSSIIYLAYTKRESLLDAPHCEHFPCAITGDGKKRSAVLEAIFLLTH
jgi:hypothetical protein